ncbi:single-stranded DNA-binding protein [Marinospirillum insulare]|uniref:Single-stranded DNA-binding protein n=1 Tax=Marinospirillum insulare TaxID=217169 RepID=A0ABQ5ZY51_9GAMM|nr:single-stranded DNA-binding protein [Marinospirillum insulare]GLR63942.1 hypothetical protein GCM10007878_13800 [Marinospirillum insulare]
MPGINKVILIGNLGAEPKTHTLDNNTLANISLATTARWKDKAGVKQSRTDWHKVIFFGSLAEVAAKYLKTGSKVYVEGRLQNRKWQNQEGVDQYTTEVVCNVLKFLDAKEANPTDSSPAENAGQYAYNQYFAPEDQVPF